MKTYARDLYVELPQDWDDESVYIYRDPNLDIEVRVEHSPVHPAATPDGQINVILERLKLLGDLDRLERNSIVIEGQPATQLAVVCQRQGDPEITAMRVAVYKPTPASPRAITLTAFAPLEYEQELQGLWHSLLICVRTVTVQ